MPPWLSALLPFERYQVEVHGHAMHVMEQGSGLPVLLLHGNPTWGFLYRKVAASLAATGQPLRLIMPDLVGLGFSAKPSDPHLHTLDFHARQLDGLLEALEIRRFLCVVHDWGGPIGGAMMAGRASQVAGLVVLNTVLSPPRPGFRPTAFHRFARAPL